MTNNIIQFPGTESEYEPGQEMQTIRIQIVAPPTPKGAATGQFIMQMLLAAALTTIVLSAIL